jgi:YD repeat-containing protein
VKPQDERDRQWGCGVFLAETPREPPGGRRDATFRSRGHLSPALKGWATSDWGYAPANFDSRAMARCIRDDVREIAVERLLYPDPAHPDSDGAGSLTAPESSYAYDAVGNLTSITNPLGLDTTFDYVGLYRLVSQTLPDPGGAGSLDAPVTTFAYDAVGNRTSLTDPAGNDTTWAYDDLDRVTS